MQPNNNNILYSDRSGGYFNNRRRPPTSYLRPFGYRHIGINHSVHFVHYYDRRIHTYIIEREWREVKKMIRRDNPRKKIGVFGVSICRNNWFLLKTVDNYYSNTCRNLTIYEYNELKFIYELK